MVIDFYVYQLRREDSEQPFYIGKGRGIRQQGHSPDGTTITANTDQYNIKDTQ